MSACSIKKCIVLSSCDTAIRYCLSVYVSVQTTDISLKHSKPKTANQLERLLAIGANYKVVKQHINRIF